eukprot:TRINITY_DN6077_c0_g1_i2.p1 TRINITY_DN6077_c0_g1~~TRINITY_DN6077_c0_g1_i2.p1  ORF type:complete len:124 (+),score=37.76 TRINITY_DN6077_c0_g1_i2:217-588(+)
MVINQEKDLSRKLALLEHILSNQPFLLATGNSSPAPPTERDITNSTQTLIVNMKRQERDRLLAQKAQLEQEELDIYSSMDSLKEEVTTLSKEAEKIMDDAKQLINIYQDWDELKQKAKLKQND